MDAGTVLKRAGELGITLRVVGEQIRYRPKSSATPEFLHGLRQQKAELIPILSPCTCDPLPTQVENGHMALAGCGPDYQNCVKCGYTWRCKLCEGCRRCRGDNFLLGRQYPSEKGVPGDGQPPLLDRPPSTEVELQRLLDHLADPVVFATWLEWAMGCTDPKEEK